MDKKEIIAELNKHQTNKIKFAIADIDGILRGKYVHKQKFIKSLDKGLGFCDVIFGWDCNDQCYSNSKITGWHTGYPDASARIDLETYRQIPWENNTPMFLADFDQQLTYGQTACSRSLLKRIDKQCRELGFVPYFSQEFEWFTFKGTPSELAASDYQVLEPITPGMFGYSILRTSLNQDYFTDLFDLLERFNIPLEGLHTETGPGALEAAPIFDEVLPAADKATLFKTAVKEIAYQHQFVASFMAKWNTNLPGCGGHLHQSLWDGYGTNLFSNKHDELSTILEHYLAGLLHCIPEILPIFAPNPNSYRRLQGGDWAPSTLTWGFENRTCAIRVIPDQNQSARIELRIPGADTNPYLVMAASLAAGLYGIKNKLKLKQAPQEGNAYIDSKVPQLPKTLEEATAIMKHSQLARELLGANFVEHFARTREWETQQATGKDLTWERRRYLEII